MALKGSTTSAVGIFIDGVDVKMARLSVKRGNVILEELQTSTLSTKLEERQGVEAGLEALTDTSDAFSLQPTAQPEPMAAMGMEEEETSGGGDNNSVFIGLLSKLNPAKYKLGYALAEPSIYYHVFDTDWGLTGKKLQARMMEELQAVRAVEPSEDAIDQFYSADKNLVTVIREDGLSLIQVLEDVKQYIGKRLPKIPLVESADIALMNLARSNFGFSPEESTAIIYIGVEYSRLIFLKGAEFYHFAPVIGEGFDSSNIRNTVYSRLLLEQDNMGLPRIDKIILAGQCRKIAFDEFMREQLPEVDVQFMTTPYLDTSAISTDEQEQISEYAVAIATAWKVLDPEHPAFYPINLLPETVRESQRAFKLAWHGYVLLVMVFFSTFYFTSRFFDLKNEMDRQQSKHAQLTLRVEENHRLQLAINSLNDQINRYNEALAVYDSIAPGSDRWSKTIGELIYGVENMNSLWVEQLQSTPNGGLFLKGFSIYRSRIPRISALFPHSTLSKVEVSELREKTPPVYIFEINVSAPPVDAAKAVPPAAEGGAQ